MADNFILPGARQDGSLSGVVISATNAGTDAQGRPILALNLSGTIAGGATNAGATTLATSQVTSTGTAATLVVARPTRRSVLLFNTHATASVWVGPATVTANNGLKLGPGASCPFTGVGLIQVIDDNSTHCVVCVADEYD